MFAFRTLTIAVLALVSFTVTSAISEDKPQQKAPPVPNEAVMKVKLKRAHSLLEALTNEDYKSLEEHATALVKISDSTAFLRAYKTTDYELQAQIFRRAAAKLAEKAQKKNLDGATLAYTELTFSCVNCHNSFRAKKTD